ncbi:MAG: GEVED domain-containing protein [Bacteroidota bacterium]
MNCTFFGFEKKCPPLLWLLALLCVSFSSICAQPNGFTDELVVDGWNQAVGVTFDENGRMYVWEKGGKVWTVSKGIKSTEPLIDISEEVGNWRDFGLVGFALDPNFLNNGHLYLWYVVDRHHLLNFGTNNYRSDVSSEKEATIARLTRYTANSSDNFTSIDYGSRKILIGESKSTGPPILHESHGAGQILFGTDGTLMVTVGDGASYASPADEGSHPSTYFQQALADGIITPEQNIGAYRCQSLNNLSGKILRIDPETGDGLPSNPYYDSANPRAPQSRTWSIGIRNPYRMAIKPESGSHHAPDGRPGTFIFGDVGWSTWEDLNVVDAPGQNFGWPIYEGISQKAGYENPLYDVGRAEHTPPKIDWRHGTNQARAFINGKMSVIGDGAVQGRPFQGNSSTAGVWYTGKDFPEPYRNTYFHADYSAGWIRNFGFDEQNNPTFVKDFKLDAGAVVCMNVSPAENGIFYVRYPNQIRKITYTGNQNKPPVAIINADQTYGTSPLTVQFDASQSFDSEYSSLKFEWDFGDNATSTDINPKVIFEAPSNAPATYPVTLKVTDAQGGQTEQTIPISLNNTPPVILSTSIDNQNWFSAAAGTTLNLSATVRDMEHPNSLRYEWQTSLFHEGHEHAEPIDSRPNTTTSLSPVECDGSTYWFRITLKVTDPEGLFTVYEKDIYPDCGGLAQTIECAPIPDQPITTGEVVLNATATSGLPVNMYLLEGPAIIFGNKIVSTGFPGRVKIRATQGGNSTYRPATPIERSFNFVLPSTANCATDGKISRDIWTDGQQSLTDNGPVQTKPNETSTLDRFEASPLTTSENTQRIRGFICPPQTGLYTFWIASNEPSQLWLSTNGQTKNKRQIALVKQSTRANQWNKYASQQSDPILLVAGTNYYIEGLANGGGHFSVGWKLPDKSLDRPISGQHLSTWKSKEPQAITFFGIPDKMTTDAPFTVNASASSGLPVDLAVIAGPATISGTTITLTGEAGTVILRATQLGDERFEAANSVERRFEVTPPPRLPKVILNSPANGSSYTQNRLDVRYTLSGDLDFYEANHLLLTLDNQAPIDIHTLNGVYTLKNLSEGTHTLKLQLANSNHQPFNHASATKEVQFTIVPTEKEQQIDFPKLLDKLTTDGPFAIAATATSGLPVQFLLESGPAVLNGNVITLIGQPGTVAVRAIQTGNEEYQPAKDVVRSFDVQSPTIEQQSQSITFPAIPNKKTTDGPFAITASASSGLPVTFAIRTGPATVDGNVITLTGESGTVKVRASQAGNAQFKRAISYDRSFTVESVVPATQQLINFPSLANKLTTDGPFAIAATATSGLPVEFSILSGPATISNNIISLTGESGEVIVRASQRGNSQYLPAPFVDRPFTVSEPITTPPAVEEVNEVSSDYCTTESLFPWQEWIGRVNFGQLDHTSSKAVYTINDYTNLEYAKNERYLLQVIPNFSWTQWDEHISVWIDFNQNGRFEETESVLRAVSLSGVPPTASDGVSATILIPNTAKIGTTRMRVAMQRMEFSTPCEVVNQGEVEDYLISIVDSNSEVSVVEKQAQSINFPAIANQLTTTQTVLLAATATSNLPVSYQILSGPAEVNGNTLKLSGTEGTVVVSAQQAGNAQFLPAQSINRAFKVSSPIEQEETPDDVPATIENYCDAKGQSPWQEWIGRVQFHTLDHISSKEGYGDFTNKETTVERGQTYQLSVSPAFSWTQWDEHINVWIDFNQNGVFEVETELVLSGVSKAQTPNTNPQSVTEQITIPANAGIGTTRMRVAMRQTNAPETCGTFEFGEVEDYTIRIVSSSSSTDKQSLVFSAFLDPKQQVDLQWIASSNQSVLDYEVERSTDNIHFETLQNISLVPEALTATFYRSSDSSPLSGVTYYRVKQRHEDASFVYSNTVVVERAFAENEFYLFPNPVRRQLRLYVKPFLEKSAVITIYNSFGKRIHSQQTPYIETAFMNIDMQQTQNGLYYVVIEVEGKRAISRKFVVNRNY